MDLLGISVAVARGFHLAALMLAFGVLVFHGAVWRTAARAAGDHACASRPPALNRLLAWSLHAAILTAIPWMLLQSARTSGAETLGDLVAGVPLVALSTTFGHAFLLRLALLLAAAATMHWRPSTSSLALLPLVGLALALQSGFSHAIAQDDVYILATHALHVVAAGAWLGALPPLWLSLQITDARQAGVLLVRFSSLGLACVAALIYTAYAQFFGMIGGVPALVGTDYGHLALLKAVIFLLLLLCAAVNRMVWTPRQLGASAGAANRGLKLTVALEVAIGLVMVAAAASLASTSPALHDQPDWPFSVQFDVAGFYYPPMRDKLERSTAAIVAALLLIAIGFLARRFAWVPFVGASVLLLAAPIPQTDILFKPAHRKTFYVSPSTFPVAAIAQGAEVFQANCARCHDPRQRTIPAFSPHMPVIPPTLAGARIARLRDGSLFWSIAHGIDDPRGGQSMPGFESTISEDDIWNVIDYLRALSAPSRGTIVREIRAPSFNASCPGGQMTSSSALRGLVVRLIATAENLTQARAGTAASKTVVLSTDSHAPSDLCAIQELEAWTAYAAIAGVAPDVLPGTIFLIDANGWLRYAFKPGTASPQQIDDAVEEISRKPLPPGYALHDH